MLDMLTWIMYGYELHAVDVVTHDSHSARLRSQRARPCTQRAIGTTELSSSLLHYFVHYLSYCSLALFMGTIHGHCLHGFYKSGF